jgi:hypothetical protein
MLLITICPVCLFYVPETASGNFPDPEIPGTSLRKVCEGGTMQAKPDPALPDAEKDSSRDPATSNAPY